MGIRHWQIGKLPDYLMDQVMREFVPYSVALGRVRGNDPSSFTPLGSGTLVSRDGRFGILTAYHCLHACSPEVSLGHSGSDCLVLILRAGKGLVLPPESVLEHPLGVPVSMEFGPDLTFVEIVPGGRLGICKAISSFWPMNQDVAILTKTFAQPRTPLAWVGFPQTDYRTVIKGWDIHHRVKHMAFFGVLESGDVTRRDTWDYLTAPFDYTECDEFPETFSGVSGGAIWALQLSRKSVKGQITINKSALIGVTFYQTGIVKNQRKLRAHFIRSVYENAWDGSGI